MMSWSGATSRMSETMTNSAPLTFTTSDAVHWGEANCTTQILALRTSLGKRSRMEQRRRISKQDRYVLTPGVLGPLSAKPALLLSDGAELRLLALI